MTRSGGVLSRRTRGVRSHGGPSWCSSAGSVVRPNWFRRTILVSLSVASALVLTACLAPDEYDPTGNEPIGHLDITQVAGSAVRVSGWAIDPNTSASVVVNVVSQGRTYATTADLARPDVAAVHRGHGERHGFEFTTPSLGTGKTSVCVWVPNVGPGRHGRLLGCRTIVLRSDDSAGRFESLRKLADGSGRLTGWGVEPELPNRSVDVQWALNGGRWNNAPTTVMRSDVNRIVGVSGAHGFSIDVPLVEGTNQICMRVPAYGRGNAADLGCRTVIVDPVLPDDVVSPVAAGLDLLTVVPVGPPAGHPLAAMSRDAGVSTILGDGSVMWFFGDTSESAPGGDLRYFVNNTAAVADGVRPHETSDAIDGEGHPVLVFAPLATPSFTPACPQDWKPVFWPLSAVTVPSAGDEGVDRVIVYLANVCLGNNEMQMSSRGVSVGEYIYDHANPPTDLRPIVGRVLTQNLFPTSARAYGMAALYDGEFVYAYHCGKPGSDGTVNWPNNPGYGPCTVGRVAPALVGDPSSYAYYLGSEHDADDDDSWSDDPRSAGGMQIPVIDESADREMPVAAFTITSDPFHGYLMVYSPWPGFTDRLVLRRGETPVGPWSHQDVYRLPGCNDLVAGRSKLCYAATAQPSFSTAGSVGIGYYDQIVDLEPRRGAYLAGTVATRWPSGQG